MVQGFDRRGVLRARDGGEQRVTPLELFFDLVYVFAITQLSHLLLDHPTVGGALQTLFLLLVVWWAWQYTTWFTNWFDPGVLSVRLLLGGVMLASLVMSVAIPEAFGERGLMFALAYVAIQVGRTGFAVLTLGTSHPLGGGFRRILSWFAASGVLWVAGGLVEGGARYVLWLLALAVDYSGPAAGYRAPGRRRRSLRALATRAGRGLLRPGGRLPDAGAGPLTHGGVDYRGGALRREVPAVRHHRLGRVHPGHGRNARRGECNGGRHGRLWGGLHRQRGGGGGRRRPPRLGRVHPGRGRTVRRGGRTRGRHGRLWGGLHRQRGAVVDLLRPQRPGRQRGHRQLGGPRQARPVRLHLSPSASPRRHHRRRGRRR